MRISPSKIWQNRARRFEREINERRITWSEAEAGAGMEEGFGEEDSIWEILVSRTRKSCSKWEESALEWTNKSFKTNWENAAYADANPKENHNNRDRDILFSSASSSSSSSQQFGSSTNLKPVWWRKMDR